MIGEPDEHFAMTRLRSAPAARRFALERRQTGKQLRVGQCVGFVLRDDFFEGSTRALLVVVAPAALRNSKPSNRTADVDPTLADDDFAILPDGGVARSNMPAMKVDERGLCGLHGVGFLEAKFWAHDRNAETKGLRGLTVFLYTVSLSPFRHGSPGSGLTP